VKVSDVKLSTLSLREPRVFPSEETEKIETVPVY
jgi:hypothetical protein